MTQVSPQGIGRRLRARNAWADRTSLVLYNETEPDAVVDLIRTFNSLGGFIAMAHVTSSMQPGAMFMYHGWDPMMFRGRQNFSGAIPTAGLLKPTSLVGNYGHIRYNTPNYVPNQTYHDHTVEFEKHVPAKPVAGPAFTATTAVRA